MTTLSYAENDKFVKNWISNNREKYDRKIKEYNHKRPYIRWLNKEYTFKQISKVYFKILL